MSNIRTLALLASLVAVAGMAAAEDAWPQFRGPDGQGNAPAANPLLEFSNTKNTRWRTPLEGRGWSSPVVSEGHVWLTTAISQAATPEETAQKLKGDPMAGIKEVAGSVEFKALCLDFDTGRIIHSIALSKTSDPEPINPMNSYASPTPTISDGKVYCDFGNYGTWCLDAMTGEKVWHRQVAVDYSVGPGSSPLVVGNHLILVCDGVDQQFVLALDKNTGDEVWRTARPPMRATNVEFKKAYSTPLVVTTEGKMQLIVPGAQWICGYAPETGEEIWRIDHGDGFSVSPRPIQAGDFVVFSTGYMRPELVAVRTDGQGDVSATHIAWRASRGAPTKPSPIVVDDRIFVVSDQGVLTQLRSEDGSIAWQERLGGNYSASPINAGGRLYFCSHEGDVTVLEAGTEFRTLAKNELGSQIMASPAVIGNDLLLRTDDALMRIGR